MTFPAFFDAMPAPDLPFPETSVTSHAIRSEAGLAVFFRFCQDFTLPPHSHGPQWGTVVAGEVAPTIDGGPAAMSPAKTPTSPQVSCMAWRSRRERSCSISLPNPTAPR